MKTKMLFSSTFLIFSCFSVISLVRASGEYSVLLSPQYVKYLSDAGDIDTSEIPGVIASLIGLPLNSDLKWKGLAEENVFKRPKAVVVFSVSSIPHGGLHFKTPNKYSTVESDGELDTELVANAIESVEWKHEPLVVEFSMIDFQSTHPDLFNNLMTSFESLREELTTNPNWIQTHDIGSLNISRDADAAILCELFAIQGIVGALGQNQDVLKLNSPDFFHFKLNGLAQLLESGVDGKSKEMKDAVHLIKSVVNEVSADMNQFYSGNVVVEVVGFSPNAGKDGLRKGRQLRSVASANGTFNLAPRYDGMYPVVFNIVLWLCIALAVALFGISWGIWNMDPGRDSVIYRMTSQRVKRD